MDTISSTLMNMDEQESLWDATLSSFGYTPWSSTDRQANNMFNVREAILSDPSFKNVCYCCFDLSRRDSHQGIWLVCWVGTFCT